MAPTSRKMIYIAMVPLFTIAASAVFLLRETESNEVWMHTPLAFLILSFILVLFWLKQAHSEIAILRSHQEALNRSKHDIAILNSKLNTILSSITNPFFALNHQWQFIYINEEAARIFKKKKQELQSKSIWESFPELIPLDFHAHCFKSYTNQEPIQFEIFLLCFQSWLEVSLFPSKEGLSVYMHDVTFQKKLEDAVRVEKENALKASHAKGEFLAHMSHEIRTPLNAIVGMSHFLKDTDLSPEQYDFVDTIQKSSETLLAILNDILDFSKIESGKLELEKIPFNLHKCVEECLDLFTFKISEKNLELLCEIDVNVPLYIIGDPMRLRQVLINLISNAIKFTEKGEIFIQVKPQNPDYPQNGKIYFSVCDTGIGIPQDRQSILFNAFSQAEAATTRKYGGTGLGLTISKKLVENMGGCIDFKSKLSEGTIFYFTIQVEVDFDHEDYLRSKILENKNFFIIDDNATNRKILRAIVQSWNSNYTEADSGLAALKILQENPKIDLFLIDMQMPGMDGIMLAGEIRKYPAYAHTPLVLLSSISNLNIQEQARPYAFSAFLNKPIKKKYLYYTIARIFSQFTCVGFPEELSVRDTLSNTARLSKSGNDCIQSLRSRFEGSYKHENANGHFYLQRDSECSLSAKTDSISEFKSTCAQSDSFQERHALSILLAEDNAINQKITTFLLKKIGYSADVVNNGIAAIDALKQKHYDLILMDIYMPEFNGIEATKRIRRTLPQEKQPTIIALTASLSNKDNKTCLESGMDGFLSKPIAVPELESILNQVARKINKGPIKKISF